MGECYSPLHDNFHQMNLKNWLQYAAEKLKFTTNTSKLDAEVLLTHALHINKAQIYAHPEREISSHALEILDTHLKQRLTGIPIAYILGEKEFWSLSFKVTSDVLIPRPETEHLVETVLELLSESEEKILELGTGSGAIAIALAKERPQWNILACDYSKAALAVAQENAMHLLPPHQKSLSFCHSNWFKNIPQQTFSAIISNPPYIANHDPHLKNLQHEPIKALTSGCDGLDDIRKIITQSPSYLQSGGILLLEHGYNQADAIKQLFDEMHFIHVNTFKDLGHHDRITFGFMD